MLKAKKLDLIVANVVLEKTLEILDKLDANYTVFKDIMGREYWVQSQQKMY
jgi:hypothetical protein